MKFEPHCKTHSHCYLCRSRTPIGQRFRESLRTAFSDLAEVDFPCPESRVWDDTPADDLLGSAFHRMLQAVDALATGNAPIQMLKSMASQLNVLREENRGGSCQNKVAYRRRLESKLRYYIGLFGPPALALQYPFRQPETQVQSPAPPSDRPS